MAAKLQRIHSMTKRSIAMRDVDIESIVSDLEAIIGDDALSAAPQLRGCMMQDGWLPIASILNYSVLGRVVWPFGGVGVVGDCLTAMGSMIVELSSDRVCVRKKPLRVQLREQLEFIFHDANYSKDVHLQLLEDKEGFAKLDLIFSTYTQTRMLLQLVPSPSAFSALVREALESSSELTLKLPSTPADGVGFVRRKTLAEKICSQVEWYLDSSRMATDRFLLEQARDNMGFVPVGTLLSFQRMRKLCHPQIAAVAHVLSKSAMLEVSPDKTLVRPRVRPPESPARASISANLRERTIAVLEQVLNDASIVFDLELQAALSAHSPAEALRSGGLGVRVPVEDVLLHPDVEAVLKPTLSSLLAALVAQRAEPALPSSAAAGAMLRKRFSELMPREGESKLVRVSDDGRFLERLTPTPEVRQFVAAAAFTGMPPPVPGQRRTVWAQGAESEEQQQRAHASIFEGEGGASEQRLLLQSDEAGGSGLTGLTGFTVMSYNLLADMLCTVEQFPSVRVDSLAWEHRFALLCKELRYHSPDVLCVQELQGTGQPQADGDHHAQLASHLASRGYDHRYVRKVRRDGTGWAHAQIGNCTFWRVGAFEYVSHEEVLVAPGLCAACADEPSRAHFGRGAQVGLVVVLRHHETGRALVVATVHLSCNFQEPCTQIAQAQLVALAAARVAATHGPGTAMVLGADLNSIPGSGVYQLLTQGALPAEHPHLALSADGVSMPDFGEFGGGGRGEGLSQPTHFQSAYATVLNHEPLFTTFTGPPCNFVGTLDYVLFAGSGLQPTHVLQLPSEETVRQEGCLPSSRFPSDHLPLLVAFSLRGGTAGSDHLQQPQPQPSLARAQINVHFAPLERLGLGPCEPRALSEADAMIISPKRTRDGQLLHTRDGDGARDPQILLANGNGDAGGVSHGAPGTVPQPFAPPRPDWYGPAAPKSGEQAAGHRTTTPPLPSRATPPGGGSHSGNDRRRSGGRAGRGNFQTHPNGGSA